MILYRLTLWLALPLLILRLWRRGAPEIGLRMAWRLPERPAGRVLWIHGASNGEIASARGVVDRALATDPLLRVLVTANTPTGRDLARGWNLPRLVASLAPFDLRGATGRFLDHWHPEGLIVIENEIWPSRMVLCAARGIPVAVLGARMSDRSAGNWRRFPGLAARVFGAIGWISAQDEASRQRLADLGVPADRLGPVVTLKSAPEVSDGASVLPWPRASTLLAASTHEGEEAMVLDAFAAARADRPDLRLILAPRHARRGGPVAALASARGFVPAVRSQGQSPSADTAVFLADTMGEMALWYRASGVTFVGGSLVAAGGHTPYEPVAARSVVVHGPHVANNAAAYTALDHAGAAVAVSDAAGLADAMRRLSSPDIQAELAERAQQALAPVDAGPAIAAALAHVLKGTRHDVHA